LFQFERKTMKTSCCYRILLFLLISLNNLLINGDRIDDLINSEVAKGFPGAGVIVVRNGEIVKKNVYGYKLRYNSNGSEIINRELLSLDTMFDLASNTKMFATNFAMMHLASLNLLNVNDLIKKHIPEYTGCNPSNQCRDTRLIRDLLTHTAGYIPSEEFYNPKLVPTDFYSQEKHKTQVIIETKLGFDRSRGGEPVYSDIDFMLLGTIVERISGLSIDQYANKYFYEPLKLTNTTFNPLLNRFEKSDCAATELKGNTRNGSISFPNVRQDVIQGQVHDEKAFYSMNGTSGHAGLFSNLNDMSLLTQIMLNNGTFHNIHFWDNAIQQLFLTPYPIDPSYGLGWRLNWNKKQWFFGEHASKYAYGHTGWTGTCTLMDPQYSIAIVLLTNKKHSPFINGTFAGDHFITGNYAQIMTLAYEQFVL